MPNIQKYTPLSPATEKALSQNKKMIKALKDKGLGLVDIAGHLKKMIGCEKPYFDQGKRKTRDIPDNANRNKALDMAIHIVDVLPSVRMEIEENRNIRIHITTDAATRAVKAANQDVIDCDDWEEEADEFLE